MYNLNGNDGQRITNLVLDASADRQDLPRQDHQLERPWRSRSSTPSSRATCPDPKIIPVYRSDASGENYLLSDYLLHQDGPEFTAGPERHSAVSSPGSPTATWPTPPTRLRPGPPGLPGMAARARRSARAARTTPPTTWRRSRATAPSPTWRRPTPRSTTSRSPRWSTQSNNAVQPTSLNVATALEKAILHADLTQDLTNVYTNPLPNAYPLSAYSYLVTPCSPQLAQTKGGSCAGRPARRDPRPSRARRARRSGSSSPSWPAPARRRWRTLGYSPLPPNLVQEDFDAVGRLNGGQEPPPVSPADCKNPYVDGQIPLPGEPAIAGQAGGGLQPTATAAAAAAGGSAEGGSGGSAGGGSAGTSGSASGGGTESAAAVDRRSHRVRGSQGVQGGQRQDREDPGRRAQQVPASGRAARGNRVGLWPEEPGGRGRSAPRPGHRPRASGDRVPTAATRRHR